MSIKEKMSQDLKAAMKAGEKTKVETLRTLLAALKQVEIDTRQDVTDEHASVILQKEIKKRREALEFAEKAQRTDLVEENKHEIALIQSYLGEQLTEDELRRIITSLKEGGMTNLGHVMGHLSKEYKGKYEGKVASQIAKEIMG